jgi:hypothetical protein
MRQDEVAFLSAELFHREERRCCAEKVSSCRVLVRVKGVSLDRRDRDVAALLVAVLERSKHEEKEQETQPRREKHYTCSGLHVLLSMWTYVLVVIPTLHVRVLDIL